MVVSNKLNFFGCCYVLVLLKILSSVLVVLFMLLVVEKLVSRCCLNWLSSCVRLLIWFGIFNFEYNCDIWVGFNGLYSVEKCNVSWVFLLWFVFFDDIDSGEVVNVK